MMPITLVNQPVVTFGLNATNSEVHGRFRDRLGPLHEPVDLVLDDLGRITGANAGLNHGRGIDQKLDRWVPARPNIALEIGGDVENKGKAAEVHQPVDIALLDGDGRFEVGRQESAHDLPRQGGMVLVHHRNRSITKFLAVALRLAHDGKGKRIDDEAQEHVIVEEASKLLEAQPENIGQRVHELTLCSQFLLA